jgi:hypothetical protein
MLRRAKDNANTSGVTYDRERRMEHFLAIALSFPAVVYTVLLGVSLVYWIFVVVGAAHVNLLGDGAADGALDAGLEGAAKAAGEGLADGLDGGHHHADGGDLDVGDAHDGGHAGALAALKLRSAPATVVLSVIILFSWILTMVGMQALEAWIPSAATGIARFVLFVLAPIIAVFPTSLVIRPLGHVFAPPKAAAKQDLVGKLCTIRTGTVTDRFGEATLDDGGAGLVVRVRVETGEKLGRGDQAVIVGYDEERQEFTVAPMEGVLDEREEPEKKVMRRS